MADRRRLAAAAVLAMALTALLMPGTARAQTVTGDELRALAERAATDPRALAQLRGIRQVDGRPVDIGRALDGADPSEVTARLRTLAEGGGVEPGGAVGADAARADAASVLGGRRFKPTHVPRPFAGVLRTLGGWLEPLAGPIRSAWRWVSRTAAAELVVVAVVFTGALLISIRLTGRRAARAVRRSGHALGIDASGLDPDQLDREAAAAERDGELERAVRLRFVAGVLRLDRAGVIDYRASLTTGQLRSKVASPSFAELAAVFDEVAYGGRPAEPSDVDAARMAWPRVLAEAGR